MSQPGNDLDNYRILIWRFTASKQWDRSLDTAKQWLSTDPENPSAHKAAAQSLISLKRFPEAEPHLKQLLAREPNNDFGHRLLSIVQFHQEQFKAADESIQKALSSNPHDSNHWYHLAWMRHKQGDDYAAARYAEKARELSPRDSDIINLLALCRPKGKAGSLLQLQQYKEALELDPENPQVHNNLGVYYLNVDKDYAKAEACFRRALFFDPTLKVSRSNLFITIKHRDIGYRALCAPRDFIYQGFALARRNRVLYYVTLPIWLIAFRFLIGALALWFFFVWPIMKVYEYLTVGDIRAKVGEPGAKRGGFLGYRSWSLRVRLLLFAVILFSFWGTTAWLALAKTESLELAFLVTLGVWLLVLMTISIRTHWKRGFARFRPRRTSKQIDKLLESKLARHK